MRYTHIRPRRMAYGGGNLSSVAAQGTWLQLFNNTAYAEYLLVRNLHYDTNAASNAVFTVTQTVQAGTSLVVVPYMPTETPPPGLLTFGASATINQNGYWVRQSSTAMYQWPHNYPLAIVPAGWTFYFQQQSLAQAMTASVMWEAIKPEQLDEGEWLQANAALIAQSG